MNPQEKLEFLAADVMRDMTRLVEKIELVSNALSGTRTAISKDTEKLLVDAVTAIKDSVDAINSSEAGLTAAAANVATKILSNQTKEFEALVRQQKEALRWLNRAANYYENNYVLWPMILSAVFGSFIGGFIVKFIYGVII